MNIVLTDFAKERHFDPDRDRGGTLILDRSPEQFERDLHRRTLMTYPGYASFCRLFTTGNWTDAKTGTLPIPTPGFELCSAYEARNDKELPFLTRWLEGDEQLIPKANWFWIVLYNRDQLAKEGTNIDADYGIVAILGQMNGEEQPMPPATMIRNALGVKEGGSGVPLDRDAYMRSVEFWNENAIVKGEK